MGAFGLDQNTCLALSIDGRGIQSLGGNSKFSIMQRDFYGREQCVCKLHLYLTNSLTQMWCAFFIKNIFCPAFVRICMCRLTCEHNLYAFLRYRCGRCGNRVHPGVLHCPVLEKVCSVSMHEHTNSSSDPANVGPTPCLFYPGWKHSVVRGLQASTHQELTL